jgi:protein TonB
MRWISREMAIGIGASALLHLSLSAVKARGAEPPPLASTTEIAVERVEPPPPPPQPEPEPEAPTPTPTATPAPTPTKAAAPPPAAAAQAAQTMTAPESATDDVADFTMVQGTGDAYAGGTTTAHGTSTNAVRTRHVATSGGAPSPVGGDGAPAAGPDRSRRAAPEADDWRCSDLFPASVDVDVEKVLIAVQVRADGKPTSVEVVRDPGRGFGPAARTCAMRQRYAPALDHDGTAVAGATRPFSVRFTR